MNVGGELRACASCTGGPSPAAWRELPLVETVASAAIRSHVSAWPANAYIEVRRCRCCGRSIARTVRAPSQ
jgi:hypothetical protein